MKLCLAISALAFTCAFSSGATVNYSVRFDATWSASTYPGAYPSGAHFSSLIGGVHDARVSFWSPGQLASPGIEAMAELGATIPLRGEVQAAISQGTAASVISGSGLSSPGATSALFSITDAHPLVTLVTMVAPSPDWFVGVHDLDLRSGNGYVESLIIPLRAYDAGTDNGLNFTSADIEALPHTSIALLGSPFAVTGPELGRFTFTRLSATPEPTAALVAASSFVIVRRRRQANVDHS